ncbi:MAG: transposase [Nitrospiraceae bacterium]|nr:MAG: transposase [Nitrospiraceae bacterium]
MKVHQAFRYELDPNNKQRTLLAKSAGVARFAYNWALADRIRRFQENEGKAKFTTAIEQHRLLNSLKPTQFPWMYEVSKCASQEALRDCERAFKNFWRARKQGRHVGFPKFKKKGIHDAFRLTGSIRVTEKGVVLPRIGEVRTKESTKKFKGRILSATVKREADRWYVSLSVETERPDLTPIVGPPVGIDLGLKAFATTSDGDYIEAPKPLRRLLRILRRRSRQHSRKQKGSNNRRKSAMRLARLHRRIRNIRTDWLHKITTRLAKTKSVIVIENLSVRRMMANQHLARAISDAGWSEFRRMLDYKTKWYGSELRTIDRFAPTSRTCSACGAYHETLTLADRVFRCRECGAVLDRDLNAAKNILKLGTESSSGTYTPVEIGGCRPEGQCRSSKQEADTIRQVVLNG